MLYLLLEVRKSEVREPVSLGMRPQHIQLNNFCTISYYERPYITNL